MTTPFLDAVRDPWRLEAACRGMDPALFFTEKGHPVSLDAKEACARCTVSLECLTYAVVHSIKQGYWGGRLPRQRHGLKSRLLAGEPLRPPCLCPNPKCRLIAGADRHGTRTGYRYWNCRCERCVIAWREPKAVMS